jgi:hypothetical protein
LGETSLWHFRHSAAIDVPLEHPRKRLCTRQIRELARFRHSNKCKNLQNVSGEENASADFLILTLEPSGKGHKLNPSSQFKKFSRELRFERARLETSHPIAESIAASAAT